MRTTTRLLTATALAAGVVGTSCGAAFAADTVGATTLTGTQVISKGCQTTTVRITAKVKGVTNDGGGTDKVRYELWDDSTLKASYTLAVPVGKTVSPTVMLSFSGLYGLSAAGVGVYIKDPQSGATLFEKDPFIPRNTSGSCDVSAKPTGTVVPTTTKPTSKPTKSSTTTKPTTKPTKSSTGPVVQTDNSSDGGMNNIALAAGAASLLGGTAVFSTRVLRRKK